MKQQSQQFEIEIEVVTNFMEKESNPLENRFVFTYQITLHNCGTETLKLTNRHWIITDGNQQVLEVSGEGVVGEQPSIYPGKKYRYTSGVVIETPLGTMQGSYQMETIEGEKYQADVPMFSLIAPGMLH